MSHSSLLCVVFALVALSSLLSTPTFAATHNAMKCTAHWTDWSPCNATTCDGGVRFRTRTNVEACSGPYTEFQPCNVCSTFMPILLSIFDGVRGELSVGLDDLVNLILKT